MNDDDAFFEAILAAPEDDLPRLVYADYLDERGDPRGELIRVQCAIEQLPPGHPERRMLVNEQRRLLLDNRQHWLEPLRDSLVRWDFVRGFLEVKLDLRTFVQSGEQLFSTLQIAGVHLYPPLQMDVSELQALIASPLSRRVLTLYLGFEWLRDDGAQLIARGEHWTSLIQLDVQYNGIRAPGIQALAKSPGFPKLRILDLSHNEAGDDGASALARAAFGERLESLTLSCADIGRDGIAALTASPALSGLKRLDLTGNRLSGRTRAGKALRRKFGERVAW